MANPILEYMQAHIGKTIPESPSPLTRWLNGILREAQEGTITFDYLVRNEMTNPLGILHGGIVAAMMDDVIGTTVICLGGEYFYTSINLVIDFLSSAKEGDTVRAVSKIIRQGRNVVNAECTLTDQHGKLLARATSNLGLTPFRTGV